MAGDTEYYLAGTHADTVYVGEGEDAKCVPIGPGDTITLSQADVTNENNVHLFEGGDTAALQIVPEIVAAEPTAAEAETKEEPTKKK